jgi:hypothetical protein
MGSNVDITSLSLDWSHLFPELHYIATYAEVRSDWTGWAIEALQERAAAPFPRLRSLAGFIGTSSPYATISVRHLRQKVDSDALLTRVRLKMMMRVTGLTPLIDYLDINAN